MKRLQLFSKTGLVLLMSGSAFLYSCGGGENKSTTATQETPATEAAPATAANDFSKGETIYQETCIACHQANGQGMPNAFPPLAGSDYLLADKGRAIEQIIKGSSGEIIVNGTKFNGTMPPQNLTDEQIADVLNYVLNSWGNNGGTVTVDEVKQHRSK